MKLNRLHSTRVQVMQILVLLLFLIFVQSNSFAEESLEREDEFITLESLIQEALKENPQIKSARASLDASEAIPKQVSTLPDPMIMSGVKNMGTKYSVGTDPMSILEFELTQKIPFPGKLSLLAMIAGKSAEAMNEEYKATLLNVIAKLKSEFFDYYHTEKSIEAVNKTIDLLKKIERTAEIRYEVGKGIQQDIWKAQLEISRLIERLQILRQMEGSTVAVINSLLNRPPDSSLGMPADFILTDFTLNLDNLLHMAEDNSPELKKIERTVEREKYGLSYAKLQYLPDFSLVLGWGERGSLESMWAVSVGVEIPIYFWRRQSYGVREARANLISQEQAYQNTKEVLFADLRSSYLAMTTSKDLMQLYKTGIIPQASASLESSMASYAVGQVDFLTMVTNVVTLLDYQLAYCEKLIDFEKAIAQIEVLTGIQFVTESEVIQK